MFDLIQQRKGTREKQQGTDIGTGFDAGYRESSPGRAMRFFLSVGRW